MVRPICGVRRRQLGLDRELDGHPEVVGLPVHFHGIVGLCGRLPDTETHYLDGALLRLVISPEMVQGVDSLE